MKTPRSTTKGHWARKGISALIRQRSRGVLVRSLLTCICLVGLVPVGAQEPECDDPPPANAPIPADLLSYCTVHPEFTCDLGINTWDPISHHSPDIRLGDTFSTTTPERPRFFFDQVGDRFYTKLYARLHNLGGAPAPATEVTVSFSYKVTADPADWNNIAIPWQSIGSYDMNIPAPATYGVLFPGPVPHEQQKGVCWHMPTGQQTFPKQFILRAEIDWSAGPDSDTTNNTAYSFYDLTIQEQPAQIAFSMDLSGSMISKLASAKDKAMLFANLVENGDQLGAYGFATGNPANTPFTATYVGTDGLSHTETLSESSVIEPKRNITGDLDRLTVAAQIFGQSAHSCTPVGQGLLRARAGLAGDPPPPAGAQKAIVLFSDGLQNVPPFVNTTPTYTCGSWPAMTNIDTALTFGDEDIQIYSVYFGPEIGWAYDLMNQIKEQTGGDYVYGAATEVELAAAYLSIRGLVDDMVYFEKAGNTGSTAPWPSFQVEFDSAAKLATVALAWPFDPETRLVIDYRQQGASQWRTSVPDPNQTNAYNVFRFEPGPNTTWEFRIRPLVAGQDQPRVNPTDYSVAVYSLVEDARLLASLDDSTFEAGKGLPVFAELRSAGHPLFNAQVEARVKVPSRSFSSTLRKYRNSFSQSIDPDTHRVTTMAKELKQLLIKDKQPSDLYLYKEVPLALRDDGQGVDKVANDGIYSGQLPGTETQIAGDYSVTVTARATLPSGRQVERNAQLSTLCNVGPIDPQMSEIEVQLAPADDSGQRLATITILPTDRFGNAAFPGSAHRVSVSNEGGRLQGGVNDQLDSSFVQELVLQHGEEGAEVAVAFGGVAMGSRIIGKQPLQRHELGLHLERAIPLSDFADDYDSGFGLALDYAYRFDRNWALRTELAMDWLDKDSGGDARLLRLNPYAQYRWQQGDWSPYAEAGLGYYDLEDADNGLGVSVGVGTRYRLSNDLSLDLGLHGHKAWGDLDLELFNISAGIIFEF